MVYLAFPQWPAFWTVTYFSEHPVCNIPLPAVVLPAYPLSGKHPTTVTHYTFDLWVPLSWCTCTKLHSDCAPHHSGVSWLRKWMEKYNCRHAPAAFTFRGITPGIDELSLFWHGGKKYLGSKIWVFFYCKIVETRYPGEIRTTKTFQHRTEKFYHFTAKFGVK